MSGPHDPVTVIVPAYDRVGFLEEAVASALAQQHPLELVIIDDGSTDGTDVLADRPAARDERIRVIHQANGGAAMARNVGLRAGHHELVANLDSDDLMAPDRLARQVAFLAEHPEMGAVVGQTRRVIVPGTNPPAHVLGLHGDNEDIGPLALSTILVRRDLALAVGGYGEGTVVAEDIELILRLGRAGHPLGRLPVVVGERRFHDDNLSSAASAPGATLLHLFRSHIAGQRDQAGADGAPGQEVP